jgi:hypothetical protein
MSDGKQLINTDQGRRSDARDLTDLNLIAHSIVFGVVLQISANPFVSHKLLFAVRRIIWERHHTQRQVRPLEISSLFIIGFQCFQGCLADSRAHEAALTTGFCTCMSTPDDRKRRCPGHCPNTPKSRPKWSFARTDRT